MIIGQEKIKSIININLTATKNYPHTLFVGGYGTGKTTMSMYIVEKLGYKFIPCLGSALDTADEMISILSRLEENSILFIDEIHSINSKAEEVLYIAMEEGVYYLDGEKISLPKFTLLGATTMEEKLSKPFRSRFQSILKLEGYKGQEIAKIIKEVISQAGVLFESGSIQSLVRASRLNPRMAVNLAKNTVNYSIALKRKIDFFLVQRVLREMSIDKKGLNENDHLYLNALKTFKKQIGLATISAFTGLSQKTIREDIEPELIKKGIIELTGKGRGLVKKNYDKGLF